MHVLTGSKRRISLALTAAAATVTAIAAVPAHAAPAPSNERVVTVERAADGTLTETIYQVAPGFTGADLANNLRARGASGVAVLSGEQASGDVVAAVAACSSGSARTWPSSATCFVRWSYNGAVRPVIDFVDHSGASWPVGRAVTEWNETSGIDSIYRPASSGCDGAPAHCVHVYSSNYGATGWTGSTSRTFNAANTYYASASVKLNDYYGGTEAQKWNTACHELGHVLGLDHNTGTESCLYSSRTSTKYPDADDYNLIERYY
ncbi:hypothetical protein GCM10009661_64520 [Catellatospora chokoriensis]|uniref:Peptidase M10 metallopeptidase domain-containing protein n=1 Tax=Catellatospora chokoriensis TaxID=310353 RepID=A0A8J3KCT0_9ACTN|nr:hypothetical protein Cch02nite_70480 [Catellatospora chokoriensis]